MNFLSLTKGTNIAAINNIENQLTDNSMEVDMKHKQASNEVALIHMRYGNEKSELREKKDALEDSDTDEYKEMLEEINMISEEEDRMCAQIEERQQDVQDTIDRENAMLEARLQAIQADQEGIDNARKQHIEDYSGIATQ